MSWSLNDLIAPLSRECFLNEYWGRNFLRIEGSPGRFSPLMDLATLERLLQEHRLDAPYFRLVRNGKSEPPSRFRTSRGKHTALNATMFSRRLAEGCSLVLNEVDEIVPAVGGLAATVENDLGVRTMVNLYASWTPEPCFHVHWDNHHVMVLQTCGSKRWEVYAPTRENPLDEDTPPPKPAGKPVWEGVLKAGDFLYLPRGWWHAASAADCPSLHLTVTMVPDTTLDFMQWFVRSLVRYPALRRDMPRTSQETDEFFGDVEKLLAQEFGPEGRGKLVERFQRNREAGRAPRSPVRLPSRAASLDISPDSRVRLAACGAFEPVEHENGRYRLQWNESKSEFTAGMVPALEAMNSSEWIAVGDLCNLISAPAERPRFLMLLAALAMEGVIAVEPGSGNSNEVND